MKIYWNGTSKNIIGSNLKKLRKKAGMTQKTLAEKLQLEGRDFTDLTILRIEQYYIRKLGLQIFFYI